MFKSCARPLNNTTNFVLRITIGFWFPWSRGIEPPTALPCGTQEIRGIIAAKTIYVLFSSGKVQHGFSASYADLSQTGKASIHLVPRSNSTMVARDPSTPRSSTELWIIVSPVTCSPNFVGIGVGKSDGFFFLLGDAFAWHFAIWHDSQNGFFGM